MSTNEKKIIASGACEENIKWELDDEGTLNISGTGELLSLASSSEWKNNKDKIKKVIIGDGITQIGKIKDSDKGIFGYCKALVSVTIPESVQVIGNCTFVNCISLKDIVIPDSVKHIGKNAFMNCIELTYINLPKGLTSIEENLFFGCKSLKNVEIPSCATEIGDGAFWGCTALAEIVIPESVTRVGYNAFYECKSLSDIIVTDNLISIGRWAFIYDTEWFKNQPDGVVYLGNHIVGYRGKMDEKAEIVIRNGCISIADYAFEYRKLIKSIVIPESVIHIGNCAFRKCETIEEIHIPNSVIYIGESVFDDCKNVEIYYDGTKAEWDEIDKNICNCDIVVHCMDGDVTYDGENLSI